MAKLGKSMSLEQCAARMERLLNTPPRKAKTRAYVATLPKRDRPAKVRPEDYIRARDIAMRQLLAKQIGSDAMVAQIAAAKAANIARERRDRLRPRISEGSHRARLYDAQEGFCGGCGDALGDDMTIDHVIPRALGGSGAIANLLLMHFLCNNEKADRMPNTFELEANERKNRALAP